MEEPDCKENGWFMDGYPRNKQQATLLGEAGVKPLKLVVMELTDQRLIEKVTLRRVDPTTQQIYHLKDNPPPKDEALQARLIQRDGDNEDVVKEQLKKYREETTGLLEAWSDILLEVNGDQAVEATVSDIVKALEAENK